MNGYIRSASSLFLAFLFSFLLATTSLGVWAERTVLNNQVFAQNAELILGSREVQRAISTYVVDEIFTSISRESAPGLSVVGELLRGAIEREVARVLGSPVVQKELLQALVATHQQSVALIKSESEIVVFDLGAVFQSVVEGLIGEKLLPKTGLRDSDLGKVYLYQSESNLEDKENLEDVRRVVQLVRQGLVVTALSGLICAVGAFIAAPRRLYGIRNVLVSILMASSLGLVLFTVMKRLVSNQFDEGPNRDAAVEILSVMMQSWNLLYVVCIASSFVILVFTLRQGVLYRFLFSRDREN